MECEGRLNAAGSCVQAGNNIEEMLDWVEYVRKQKELNALMSFDKLRH